MSAARLLALLLLLALGPAEPSRGEWRLWEDYAPAPRLDQEQSSGDYPYNVDDQPRRELGQTFRPTRPDLHRIDVQLKNLGDERPARLRLWRWRGSLEATRAHEPIFEDRIGLAGHANWQTRSVFPELRVEPGADYYFQLDARGRSRFKVRTQRERDAYSAGRLIFARGSPSPQADLWFRTWSAEGGARRERAKAPASAPIRWSPPSRSPASVDSSDYLERVSDYARSIRPRLGDDCGRHDYVRAFYDAFLYALSCEGTCDERLARGAIERLDNAAGWFGCDLPVDAPRHCRQRCKPASGARSYSLVTAAPAYRWLENSPSWRPEVRARVRDYLADVGETYWPRRVAGTSNRAFRAAASYLHLAQIRPEHPSAEAWHSYGRQVWENFRAHLDFEMDTASYESKVMWPGLLALAEVSGEADQLWREAGFRSIVDRTFQQTAPLGVLPGYGDSNGWAFSTPGLVWLFEEAARRTGEGRYRWLAHRVYAYNASHARDAPPRGDSWSQQLYDLAHAYLAASAWGGEPEPPAPLQSRRAAGQPRGAQRWSVAAGERVGQSVAHPGGTLVRIDLGAVAPAGSLPRIRIWPWRGSPSATRAALPLYSAEAVSTAEETLSAFPVLAAGRHDAYYVELQAGAAGLEVVGLEGNAYPEGRAVGLPRASEADLRFGLHTLRGYASALTHREESEPLPVEQWGEPRRTHEFSGRRVPDKLVLRSGPRPEDLFVLVNLLKGYNHGQANLGAVSVAIDGGSVVLGESSSPYFEHALRPEEENIALVRRYRGGTPVEPGRSVEVPRFVDTRNLSVAWLHFRDVEGWGVPQERRFYFVKNRLLWIRDRFDLPAGMRAAVGAVWHPAHVEAPGSTEAGHRIAYPHPLENVWPFHNPARFARLFMPDAPGTTQRLETMSDHVPTPDCEERAAGKGPIPGKCRFSPYYALHRSWSGDSGSGRSVWIDTVIVPEAPDETSTLRVLPVQGPARAFELRIRGERWLLLDNPERRTLDAAGLRSDALYVVASANAADAPFAHVAEATSFEGLGLRLASEAPSTTERGAFDPARP